MGGQEDVTVTPCRALAAITTWYVGEGMSKHYDMSIRIENIKDTRYDHLADYIEGQLKEMGYECSIVGVESDRGDDDGQD